MAWFGDSDGQSSPALVAVALVAVASAAGLAIGYMMGRGRAIRRLAVVATGGGQRRRQGGIPASTPATLSDLCRDAANRE